MTTRLTKTVSIQAARETVFDTISHPARLPEWIPSLTDVRSIVGAGVGQTHEWTYKMVGLRFRGRTEVVESRRPEKYVYHTTGGIDSTWTYELADASGARTELTLTIEYRIPLPVLDKLAERLVRRRNERELEVGLAHLKDMLEV